MPKGASSSRAKKFPSLTGKLNRAVQIKLDRARKAPVVVVPVTNIASLRKTDNLRIQQGIRSKYA